MLALCVAQVLAGAGLSLTKYIDGVYFKVLEELFAVVFLGSGPQAHRRPGNWVLNTFPDTDDILEFRLGGIE